MWRNKNSYSAELYNIIVQVQFIDAWHQICKLREIYFEYKTFIYTWVFLFAINVLFQYQRSLFIDHG